VLATVKGDVHDIGKNLVDIILTNNGYKVVNLGIKQPSDVIINSAQEHKADAIGLSGLLVKSTLEMKYVVQDLQRQKLQFPVICGGAALTRKYVEDDLRREYNGGVFYAEDAFAGLHVMERSYDADDSAREKRMLREARTREGVCEAAAVADAGGRRDGAVAPLCRMLPTYSEPPFWGVRSVSRGFRPARDLPVHQRDRAVQEPVAVEDGVAGRLRAAGGEKYRPILKDLEEEVIAAGWFEPKSVYGYFGSAGRRQ
jgi:5-methyltetrahydrofolate--homocysteine methyltransferase